MRNQLLIVIILVLFGCKTEVDNWSTINISGKVDSPDIDKILFFPQEQYSMDENSIQQIEIDSTQKFSIIYPINQPTEAILILGKNGIKLYLEPGEDLSIDIKLDNTVYFLQENKSHNSILHEYQKKFSAFFTSNLDYRLPPEQFSSQVDSVATAKESFLNKNKNKLDDRFITYLENDIRYCAANEKIYYARRYASKLIKEETNYFDFLKSFQIQNNQANNIQHYHDFIDNYINYLYLKKIWSTGADYKNDYIEKYYIAKAELSGKVLEYFLTENLILGIDLPIEKEKFNEITEEFLLGDYSDKSKNILRQKLSAFNASGIAEGKMAPEFQLLNNNGRLYSLSDFTKDYVVLDFWASWCGPCRQEIPEMIELAEKFRDKAQFIFISIDNNKSSWEKATKQLKIPQPSLLIDSIAMVDYGFKGYESVPFYLVLDKNKKVILRNTTKEEIEKLLLN
ncbi:TlpA family protein disulfide reductase [Sunxiuqinia rutila]|uniref:TlpA family protein disulfide reductase n=1 Tax=Sunxiuqinia rutila TaxID=1397841 RepID=UPI003D360378